MIGILAFICMFSGIGFLGTYNQIMYCRRLRIDPEYIFGFDLDLVLKITGIIFLISILSICEFSQHHYYFNSIYGS